MAGLSPWLTDRETEAQGWSVSEDLAQALEQKRATMSAASHRADRHEDHGGQHSKTVGTLQPHSLPGAHCLRTGTTQRHHSPLRGCRCCGATQHST